MRKLKFLWNGKKIKVDSWELDYSPWKESEETIYEVWVKFVCPLCGEKHSVAVYFPGENISGENPSEYCQGKHVESLILLEDEESQQLFRQEVERNGLSQRKHFPFQGYQTWFYEYYTKEAAR